MNSPKPIRFSRSDYHRLGEVGIFQSTQHLELIFGEIIEKSPKRVAHESCLRTLLRQLFQIIPDSFVVGCQSPIAIGDSSEPEPDVSIAIGPEARYLGRHPLGSDLLLAIEISKSTLPFDRSTKSRLYASAAIADYWIFNLVDHRVEAFSEPALIKGSWEYQKHQIHLASEKLKLPFLDTGEPRLLDLSLISL